MSAWSRMGFGMKASVAGPLVLAAVVALLDVKFGTTWLDVALTYLIAATATAAGWVMAIVLGPYTDEQKRFATYLSAISAFVTGYVAGKLDRAVDAALSADATIDPLAAARICTFVVFFFCGAILAYIVRRIS